jgi:transcriptional regulator with XRE-family HTH domain
MLHVPRKKTAPPGKSELGDRFWQLRNHQRKTQDQLAPLTRLEVNNIENGRNRLTSANLQAKAAAAFGVRADDLMAYLNGAIDLEALEQAKSAPSEPSGPWSLQEGAIMKLVGQHRMKMEVAEEIVPRIAFQHRYDDDLNVDKLVAFVLAISGKKQSGIREEEDD